MMKGDQHMAAATRSPDWRVLLFALVLPSCVTAIYFQLLHGREALLQQGAFTIGKAIQFAFPVVWVWQTTPGQIRAARFNVRGMLWGIAFGMAVVAGMFVLYSVWIRPAAEDIHLFEQTRAKLEGLGIDRAWKYALLGLFYAGIHSFLEEYYWRWFVFGQLRSVVPVSVAILISSVGFMAHHVIVLAFYFGWLSPLTYLFSAAVAIGGAVWAWLYDRSGSIYSPWLSHLIIDAGIFLIGYDVAQDLLIH
jgi:membrane protease YdiL (CAAX protease family)